MSFFIKLSWVVFCICTGLVLFFLFCAFLCTFPCPVWVGHDPSFVLVCVFYLIALTCSSIICLFSAIFPCLVWVCCEWQARPPLGPEKVASWVLRNTMQSARVMQSPCIMHCVKYELRKVLT